MNDKTLAMDNLGITNFTENLQYLLQKNKTTSIELAEAVGVSPELIGKLKNGYLNNPSLKVLSGISNYFKVSLQDFVFGNLANTEHNFQVNLIQSVPVINWDEIEDWKKKKANKYIMVDNIPGKNVFALYIDRRYGRLKKEAFIFIDTELKPSNDDYVLVLNNKNKTAHLKKLIIDDAMYLQSLILDAKNVIRYDDKEYLIYGTVIGYQKNKIFNNTNNRI